MRLTRDDEFGQALDPSSRLRDHQATLATGIPAAPSAAGTRKRIRSITTAMRTRLGSVADASTGGPDPDARDLGPGPMSDIERMCQELGPRACA